MVCERINDSCSCDSDGVFLLEKNKKIIYAFYAFNVDGGGKILEFSILSERISSAFFYFSIGAYISLYDVDTERMKKSVLSLWGIVYLVMTVIDTFQNAMSMANGVVHRITVLLGMVFVMCVVSKYKLKEANGKLTKSVFFILVSHPFVLIILKDKILMTIGVGNPIIVLFSFALTLVVVVTICTSSYILIDRYFPKVAKVFCGR